MPIKVLYTQEVLEQLIRVSARMSRVTPTDDQADPPTYSEATPESDYSEVVESGGRQAVFDAALKAGMTIVRGTEHSLLLDLDHGAAIHMEALRILSGQLGPFTTEAWVSKSGEGQHVVLTFAERTFTDTEAILLETALGSDPRRAVLGLLRVQHGIEAARALFRPTSPLTSS